MLVSGNFAVKYKGSFKKKPHQNSAWLYTKKAPGNLLGGLV